MATATAVKVIRPRRLTEKETLSTFEDWRNNLEFYLIQETNFQTFIHGKVWRKTVDAADFRGLETADQARYLEQFLGVIASLSPPLLHGDILNDTTTISDVYKLLRTYYQFAPSESTFIKFSYIKREIIDGSLERPVHLYLRMRQFIRDNLLLSSGRIKHDGDVPATNELMSPTTERLVVLRWLEILHPALPNHVSKVFAHDLQTKSLKELYPQLVDQIEDLITQAEGKSDDMDAQFAKLSFRNRKFENHYRDNRDHYRDNRDQNRDQNRESRTPVSTSGFRKRTDYDRKTSHTPVKPTNPIKKCLACQSVGEPFIGHDIRGCPNIMPSDRNNLLKSFHLEVDPDSIESFSDQDTELETVDDITNIEVDNIQVVASPRFHVKINKTMVTMILDTGASGSMISLQICELAGLQVYPSTHKAVQADGDSYLNVVGEVHTSIVMDGNLRLPLSAVVVTKLKAGLIVGMNFMRENKVVIDIPNNSLYFPNRKVVHFGTSSNNPKVGLLRTDVNHIIFPGDSIDIPTPANFMEDHSVAVEPRMENNNWPSPSIIDNDDGVLSIVNHLDVPLKIKKNQVIAQVRSVKEENDVVVRPRVPKTVLACAEIDYTKNVVIDPDSTLTPEKRIQFQKINESYKSVFDPNHGTYNDKSGKFEHPFSLVVQNPLQKRERYPHIAQTKPRFCKKSLTSWNH